MKCLTDKECSEWLAKRGLTEDPYGFPRKSPRFYKQFKLPAQVSELFRGVVSNAEPFGESLVHVTDWEHYQPDEMEVMRLVRKTCGENADLIDRPGHIFSAAERDPLVGFITLVSKYDWSAYVYFDHGLTLLSWQGELMDLWSADGERYDKVCSAMEALEIEVTSRAEDECPDRPNPL